MLLGRTIFYRGYQIQEESPSVYFSISGPRPQRAELAIAGSSGEAMKWIDQRLALAAEVNAVAQATQGSLWGDLNGLCLPAFG